jgi:hypothetical protein
MPPKKYADDYETIVTQDENGREKTEVVYRGEFYETSLDGKGLIRFKNICLMLLGIIVALQIGAGFINNPGMYMFYVAIPYTLAFFPLIYTAEGTFRLPREKRPYRRDEIGLSFKRIKIAGSILLGFLAAGLLGEIIFTLIFAQGSHLDEYAYLALELAAVTASLFLQYFARQVHIQPQKGGK